MNNCGASEEEESCRKACREDGQYSLMNLLLAFTSLMSLFASQASLIPLLSAYSIISLPSPSYNQTIVDYFVRKANCLLSTFQI